MILRGAERAADLIDDPLLIAANNDGLLCEHPCAGLSEGHGNSDAVRLSWPPPESW